MNRPYANIYDSTLGPQKAKRQKCQKKVQYVKMSNWSWQSRISSRRKRKGRSREKEGKEIVEEDEEEEKGGRLGGKGRG